MTGKLHLNRNHNSKSRLNSIAVLCRLVLYQNEVYRLPPKCRAVRVLGGIAWMAVAGQDIFIARGEIMALASTKDFALVSALGNDPLILEVLGDDDRHFHSYVGWMPLNEIEMSTHPGE